MIKIHSIKRVNGVAGEYGYVALVEYPNEPICALTFTSSTYGGPVVMVTDGNPGGMFVSNPERFGPFGPEWVRRFFTDQA